ncbi:MAG: gamma-glutamyltransferase family protein [Paracoccaceae bacterium]
MRDFHLPGRSPVFASNGLCATSHPLAAASAVQILQNGGNAVDAAIAAAVLLGICEPHSTGIGGDCFVLLKPAGEERIIALNGSGRAPAGLQAEVLRNTGATQVPLYGPEAVTIPGAVDAFCKLSNDWGKLGLAASLAPAIRYAQEGVPVTPRTAFDWANAASVLSGDACEFYLQDTKPLAVGDVYRHQMQSAVLQKIAQQGRAGFYEGEVAQDMVTSLNALGGCHSLQDFADVSCTYSDPVSGEYKGVELVEHPPNGQGATAILLANILSHFDIAGMEPLGAMRAHIEAEATKLAYDARNRFIADPGHTNRLEHMLSAHTAASLAALIGQDTVITAPHAASENVHKDTAYLTVVDKDLMAVSMIYSIYHSFGSGLASAKYGILFQNRGAGFCLEPGHPNEAGPGKRPMHTIIPGMLRKGGQLVMPFGVMGGAYQATGHARFLSNTVDFDMHPQQAIDAPRAFSDVGALKIERGYDREVVQELADMGHVVTIPETPIGGAQAILIDHERGVLQGASDPRKDGAAIGY